MLDPCRLPCLFDTVPEPMMVPAASSRVRAACATSCAKLKVMSSPAFGLPKGWRFSSTSKGRCSLAPFQSAPNSSGVTATGENALAAFDWKKPKPLALVGNQVAQRDVVDQHDQP